MRRVRRNETVVLLDIRLDGTAVRQRRSAAVMSFEFIWWGSIQK